MIDILHNRKLDNRESRLIEFLRWHALLGSAQELRDIIDRAFEAGVAAKSDADFAWRMHQPDLAEMITVICQDRPVASMNVKPGGMIALIRKEEA
jgi:hypothetical protein